MKLTLLTLSIFFLQVSSESPLCSKCRNTRDRLIDKLKNLKDSSLNGAISLCSFALQKSICNYYVMLLGNPLLDNSEKYLKETDYLCSTYFCEEADTVQLKLYDFKNYLQTKLPRKSKERTSWADESTFKIAVINDVHLQRDYKEGTLVDCGKPAGCCSEKVGAGKKGKGAGFWGTRESTCDIPNRTFEQTLKFIREKQSVDYVFSLGDLISHDDWLLSEDLKAENNQYVLDKMREHFWDGKTLDSKDLDMPFILPVVGNHEGHPLDYDNYDDPDSFFKKRIFPAFESLIGKERVKDLSDKGFYTFKDEKRNIRFLSINSNVNNLYNSHAVASPTNPLHILNNIAQTLYESENNKEKVIILTHIPIADDSSQTVFARFFKILMERFKDTLSCSLSAHTHNDQLKFYRGEDKKHMMMEFISPSLTTFGGINPSFRVYEFSGVGEFRNYVQFRFNIDVMNIYAEQGDFRFDFEQNYSFVEEYQIETQGFWSKGVYLR